VSILVLKLDNLVAGERRKAYIDSKVPGLSRDSSSMRSDPRRNSISLIWVESEGWDFLERALLIVSLAEGDRASWQSSRRNIISFHRADRLGSFPQRYCSRFIEFFLKKMDNCFRLAKYFI